MAGDSVFLHHDTGISVFHAGLSHCSHYSYHYVPAPDYLSAGTVAPEKGESFSDSVLNVGMIVYFVICCGLFILNW